ncbi:Hpt domain-containing protein [Salipiger mucosus]|uniref:Chemotaxis protein histidine kinase n=1 Tax=Salipiger mucosus DSM 16094 TaxID=1123237 RepID=S9QS15_9RHOB|nr:Hpt domain-containing protein [Salipiger mucosus]EPX82453.1 Chemotaxis protein histidine kinase [Salipiger mucosus DSM 16094]
MIDWDRVAELHEEIGPEDFGEVVTLFLREVEMTLSELPSCRDSPPILGEQLHFLKGSALNLGFSALAALCETGEATAASGAAEAVDIAAIRAAYADSRLEFLHELPVRMAA